MKITLLQKPYEIGSPKKQQTISSLSILELFYKTFNDLIKSLVRKHVMNNPKWECWFLKLVVFKTSDF